MTVVGEALFVEARNPSKSTELISHVFMVFSFFRIFLATNIGLPRGTKS